MTYPYASIGKRISFRAQTAITKGQFVKLHTALASDNAVYVVPGAAEGDAVIGVAITSASADQAVEIETMPGSIVPVLCGGSIAHGAQVECDASGRAVTAAGAAARSLGQIIGAAASGETVSLLFRAGLNTPPNV